MRLISFLLSYFQATKMLRKCFALFMFVAITTEFVRSEEEACWEKCLQVFTNFMVLLLQDCFKTHHTSQGLKQNFGPSIFQCMFYVAKIQLLNFPEMACSIFENGVSCSLKPCKGFYHKCSLYWCCFEFISCFFVHQSMFHPLH